MASESARDCPVSCLDTWLREARRGLDPWQPTPAEVAARIGRQCSRAEIEAALARIDALAAERDRLPEWDGDTSDDIWQAQRTFQHILANIPPVHAAHVTAGLRSPRTETRMIVALALSHLDHETVAPALRAALDTDPDSGVRSILATALARIEGRGGPEPWC